MVYAELVSVSCNALDRPNLSFLFKDTYMHIGYSKYLERLFQYCSAKCVCFIVSVVISTVFLRNGRSGFTNVYFHNGRAGSH